MQDGEAPAFEPYRLGLHHAAAGVGAIARMDVYVLAPQAPRAVIGIPAAAHCLAAHFASEVLTTALEFLHRDARQSA